jgi:hypothetical protein
MDTTLRAAASLWDKLSPQHVYARSPVYRLDWVGNYSSILQRNELAAAGRDLGLFPAITARHIQSEFPRPPAIRALQG